MTVKWCRPQKENLKVQRSLASHLYKAEKAMVLELSLAVQQFGYISNYLLLILHKHTVGD
jgi:hypothetical protein